MPINASSAYPNNKNFHKPCFANGKTNDASALSGLAFGKAFEDFPTNFNIPAPLKIGARELLYKLLGDDIFPLKPRLMKRDHLQLSLFKDKESYWERFWNIISKIENFQIANKNKH